MSSTWLDVIIQRGACEKSVFFGFMGGKTHTLKRYRKKRVRTRAKDKHLERVNFAADKGERSSLCLMERFDGKS